jgi:uncharacterized membrane protein
MAFCANCGAAVAQETGFCGSCGKPIGPANQAVPSPPTISTGNPVAASTSGLTSNLAAALAYVLGFITGIIFLVLEPYKSNRFVRFHAMQSVLFSVACLVFWIAWDIVWRILFSISGFFAVVDLPLSMVISLGIFLLWLFVMYQAYSEREFRIPFIGALAAKQLG